MLNFELFVVGSSGRGGISEAASLGGQSWRLGAGVQRPIGPDAGTGKVQQRLRRQSKDVKNWI